MLDEEIASYKEAVAIDPRMKEAYYNLGVAYRLKGRFQEELAAHMAGGQ